MSFECLFRIDRTKPVEQESRAIAGKPYNAAVKSLTGAIGDTSKYFGVRKTLARDGTVLAKDTFPRPQFSRPT